MSSDSNDEDYRHHVTEANRNLDNSIMAEEMIRAQVHATLALAAAVRELDISVYKIFEVLRDH